MPSGFTPPAEDQRVFYDPAVDLFVLAEPGPPRIRHPLSVTLMRGDAVVDKSRWNWIIQKLSSWGVLRLHVAEAEAFSRQDLQIIQEEATRLGLILVFSIGDNPAAPNLDLPADSRLHIPVSPNSTPERFDFLGRHVAGGFRVRALTLLGTFRPELLVEAGGEMADIQEWTISPPISSPDEHWLPDPDNAEPPIISQLRNEFPWARIEYACYPARENSILALSNGEIYTTEPITAERIFLGELANMTLADLLENSDFDFDLHLKGWVRIAPEAHSEVTSLQELASEPAQAQPFAAFVSYDSADWPEVQALVLRLKKTGIRIWVDKWEIRPGDDWLKALEAAIGETSVMLVFIGQKGELVSPYHEWEPRLFLQEMKTRNLRLIPVILESAPRQINLPLTLKSHHHVDFRENDPDHKDDLTPFERLVWGITGKKPG